jgi:hypothetical protein
VGVEHRIEVRPVAEVGVRDDPPITVRSLRSASPVTKVVSPTDAKVSPTLRS